MQVIRQKGVKGDRGEDALAGVPIAANTVLANPSGVLANPVGVDAAGMRTLLSSVSYASQTLTDGQRTQFTTNINPLIVSDAANPFVVKATPTFGVTDIFQIVAPGEYSPTKFRFFASGGMKIWDYLGIWAKSGIPGDSSDNDAQQCALAITTDLGVDPLNAGIKLYCPDGAHDAIWVSTYNSSLGVVSLGQCPRLWMLDGSGRHFLGPKDLGTPTFKRDTDKFLVERTTGTLGVYLPGIIKSGTIQGDSFETIGLYTTNQGIRFMEVLDGLEKFRLYRNSTDPNLYLRDMANARFLLSFTPGTTVDNSQAYFLSTVLVDGLATFKKSARVEGLLRSTKSTSGLMVGFGANAVDDLLTFSYDTIVGGSITVESSVFGPLVFSSKSNNNIILDPHGTGKVHIGPRLTAPTAKLTVTGDMSVSSTATFAESVKLGFRTTGTLPSAASSSGERYQVSNSPTVANRIAFSNGSAWYYEGTAVAV